MGILKYNFVDISYLSLPDLLGVSPPEEGAAGVAADGAVVEVGRGGGAAHAALRRQTFLLLLLVLVLVLVLVLLPGHRGASLLIGHRENLFYLKFA